MPDSRDRDDFEARLDEDPADWDLRLVYADWLEEQGDARAANAQRWMAAERVWPHNAQAFIGSSRWGWWCRSRGWNRQEGDDIREKRLHGVPREIHITNVAGVEGGMGVGWPYLTRQAAEAALAEALEKTEVTA